MKSIELYTAAVDNGGRRVEAGTRVAVGNGKDQITAERAQSLVDRAGAVVAVGAEVGEAKVKSGNAEKP